ncbi:MAG: hypothetical protein JWN48_3477 [Myxococcaceae bacterium]|nr:hypothetical protein [Myxococcaceae bacterium]
MKLRLTSSSLRVPIGSALAALLLAACTSDDNVGQDKARDPALLDAGLATEMGASTAVDGSVAAVTHPTWHRDIAPLVSEKCSSCHVEGGIAPFSMKSYATAKPFAEQMARDVESGKMPPFLAQETASCKPPFPWLADLRLSAAQKALLRAWADTGAPEGDPLTAAPLVPPAPVAIEREDLVAKLPQPITVEGTKDIHQCIVMDPQFTKDTYLVSRLITSGNPKVLHHVVSYVLPPGQVDDGAGGMRPRTKAELEAALRAQKGVGIGGSYPCFGSPAIEAPLRIEIIDAWAPGGIANKAPADSGQPISKDSLVIFDIHYHPTGGPAEIDTSTKLSLMTTETKPKYISKVVLLGNFAPPVLTIPYVTPYGDGNLVTQADETAPAFRIPANAKNHIEEMTWKWKLPTGPLKVYAMGTHMHYVGRGMRITVDHAAPVASAPATECLIETPAWDFNWQRGYGYDAPSYEALPTLANGDLMHFRCDYDNTLDNPFLARALDNQGKSAPVDVVLGEDTLDEMCLGAVGIIYPNL